MSRARVAILAISIALVSVYMVASESTRFVRLIEDGFPECDLVPGVDVLEATAIGPSVDAVLLALEDLGGGGDIGDQARLFILDEVTRIERWASEQARLGSPHSGYSEALGALRLAVDVRFILRDRDAVVWSLTNLVTILSHVSRSMGTSVCDEAMVVLLSNLDSAFADPWDRLAILRASAMVLRNFGLPRQAEHSYLALIELLSKIGSFEQRDEIEVETHLNYSVVLRELYRLKDAERQLHTAIEIAEERLAPNHEVFSRISSNFAVLHSYFSRGADLEGVYSRLVALQESRGHVNFDLARSYYNRGRFRARVGNSVGAISDYYDALSILRQAGLELTPEELRVHLRLVPLLRAEGRSVNAVRHRDYVQEHLGIVSQPLLKSEIMQGLGEVETAERAHVAEEMFKESLSLRVMALGSIHPLVAETLFSMALLRIGINDLDEAVELLRLAGQVYDLWLSREASGCRAGDSADYLKSSAIVEGTLIALAIEASEPQATESKDSYRDLVEELFRFLQIATETRVAAVERQSHLRSADVPTLRRFQDVLARQCELNERYFRTVLQNDGLIATDARLDYDTAMLEAESQLIETRETLPIAVRSIVEQAVPRVQLSDLYRILEPREILVQFFIGDSSSFRFEVLRQGDELVFQIMMIPSVGMSELEQMVSQVRSAMVFPSKEFDRTAARALYELLFANMLNDDPETVFIVADGPLDRLPFAVLLDESNQWIVDRWSVSILTSAGSLVRTREKSVHTLPTFVGIGNPELKANCLSPSAHKVVLESLFRGESYPLAKKDDVLCLGQVVGAEGELRDVAAMFDAKSSIVISDVEATESNVRVTDFSEVGIVLFSTHGIMAGSELNLPEPSLILTPGDGASRSSDGVFTKSDIRQLELDDVWLAVLSACDTGASDGVRGGLSGLAEGFLYAGVETMLVSHWRVHGDAARALMTEFFQGLLRDELKVAEALRRAIAIVRDTEGFGHPVYWAPFALVGDGQLSVVDQ